MTTASKPDDELPRLLSALEDGTLAPDDEARLADLLQNNPAARSAYYDHVMLAALLRREGRRAAAQSSRHAPRDESLTRSVRTTMSARSRLWLAALAASVLLMLALSVGEATGVTQLVPTIIRIATGEGSLVIEVDDPSVSVTLDGQDVTITGAGIHELRLRPGTHKFIATRNGQPLREEVVTIEHGGRQIVRVSRQPVPSDTGATSGRHAAADSSPQVVPIPTTSASAGRFEGHREPVPCVAFTPDGGRAFTASWDGTVRSWDVPTGREFKRINLSVHFVAVSPDGRNLLAAGSSDTEGKAWLLDLESLQVLRECARPRPPGPGQFGVTSAAYSPDGEQALLGHYDGVVQLWDVKNWRETGRLDCASGLWSVAVSPSGQQALTAGGYTQDGQPSAQLHLWRLPGGSKPVALDGHEKGAWRAIFSPSGNLIASASNDGTVRIWAADGGKQLGLLTHPQEVAGLAFCPDGRLVSVCYDGVVRLWDAETGRELHRFVGHSTEVISVAVSSDGKHMLSGGTDGSVRLWDLPLHKASEAPVGTNR